MRKPLMALAIAGCFVMSVVGGLVPILQGWIFFVLGLYLLATEFETGRLWVKRLPRAGRSCTAGSCRRATINGRRGTSRSSRI